jgi:hypothetical protein
MKKFNSPAAPGTVLKKPDKGKEILLTVKQTQYRSGEGKGMHIMQNSQPDTYNAVYDLARHMTCATQVHYDAMTRMIKYVDDTSDRGLVLNPTRKWDGGARNTSLSLVVVAIPTMQKIRRRKRASPDTGSYWKVHMHM